MCLRAKFKWTMVRVPESQIKINWWVTQTIMLLKGNPMYTNQQIDKTITNKFKQSINIIKATFKTIRLESIIPLITQIEVKIFKGRIKQIKMKAIKINRIIIWLTKINPTIVITSYAWIKNSNNKEIKFSFNN